MVSRRFFRFQFKFGFEVWYRVHVPALMLHYERRIVTSVFFFGFGLQRIKMAEFNEVFLKWSRNFIEFSEFSESENH